MGFTANIGKRSKAWRTWRDGTTPSHYYDEEEFIKETQKQEIDDCIAEYDCDLAGIPPELWPEIDRKEKGKVDNSTKLLDSRTTDKKYDSRWPSYTPPTTYVSPTSYAVEKCHEGNVLVFTAGNVSVYGGGNSRGLKVWEDSFMIDMGDVVDEKYVEFAGCYYPELFTLKLIKVACKDYSIPNIGDTFWSRLVNILKNESVDKPIKVVCCCLGGHGRTGIALSILAGLFDVVPTDVCPVTWVREHYCKNAVESDKQLNYIEEVTGRKVTAEEPKSKWSTIPLKGGESTYPYTSGYGM
jgi:hypothetical protein